ncbi:uncharacterized protein LOC144314109 [Canis aureus]
MAVPRRSDEASAGRRAAVSGPPRPGEERRPRRPAPPGLRLERAAPGRRGSLSGCCCGGRRAAGSGPAPVAARAESAESEVRPLREALPAFPLSVRSWTYTRTHLGQTLGSGGRRLQEPPTTCKSARCRVR